jgi:hypothetical protein
MLSSAEVSRVVQLQCVIYSSSSSSSSSTSMHTLRGNISGMLATLVYVCMYYKRLYVQCVCTASSRMCLSCLFAHSVSAQCVSALPSCLMHPEYD